MKVLLLVLALAICAGCVIDNVNSFTATGDQQFEPRAADYAIEVLDEMPDRAYVLLGYAEARGSSLNEALPYLLKHAREQGGDAIANIETSQIGGGGATVGVYRAAVIRYTEET